MRTTIKILASVAVLTVFGTALAGDIYQIDPVHSSISFKIRHLVISKVKGRFDEFSGTIDFNEKELSRSKAEVEIATASVDTDNKDRDQHLKSAEFFDVKKYPTMTFKSKRIDRKGEKLVAVGDLTLHGVTREVELPIEFGGKIVDPWGKTRIAFEGNATIDRTQFGLKWSKTMDNGGLMVGNEVNISLSVEAIKQQ